MGLRGSVWPESGKSVTQLSKYESPRHEHETVAFARVLLSERRVKQSMKPGMGLLTGKCFGFQRDRSDTSFADIRHG